MANSYSTVTTSNSTFLSDIYAAMSTKYGAELTLHTLTTTDYVFTLPALCEKVLRINYTSSDIIYLYAGDAFTSGTTITNSSLLASSQTSTSYANYKGTGHLVLGTSFLLLNVLSTHAYEKSTLILIGKATNGNSLSFIFSGSAQSAEYLNNCVGRNITNKTACGLITFQKNMVSATGKPYKMPLQFTNALEGGLVLENEDGSLATIAELYACSWSIDVSNPFVGANAFITTAQMVGSGFTKVTTCALLAEW